jgi:16S rRNA (cytosine1402-N4)-methyltransferase
MKHIPVLLGRVLETLGDIRGKTILDGTFGNGGYSRAFLERGTDVIAFDRDPNVVAAANALGAEYPDNFKFVLSPFSEIANTICIEPDAAVFDLGVSSMQIDDGARGFSFRFDGPLDMRMEQYKEQSAKRKEQITAAELIEESSVEELVRILRDYGDVGRAVPIARAIRDKLPKTTFELRDLIFNPHDVAPVFQALRIAVNDELGQVRQMLGTVPQMLAPDGVCICVTFHSLEDRLVKNEFRRLTTPAGDPRLPNVAPAEFAALKTFVPDDAEIAANPRARSAHLRAVRRLIKSC